MQLDPSWRWPVAGQQPFSRFRTFTGF